MSLAPLLALSGATVQVTPTSISYEKRLAARSGQRTVRVSRILLKGATPLAARVNLAQEILRQEMSRLDPHLATLQSVGSNMTGGLLLEVIEAPDTIAAAGRFLTRFIAAIEQQS